MNPRGKLLSMPMPSISRMKIQEASKALVEGAEMRELELRFKVGPVALLTEIVRDMLRREARRERARRIAA